MKTKLILFIIPFVLFCHFTEAKDCSEKLFTGTQTEKYQNGNTKYEVHYLYGKKEGAETFWYNSGLKYIQTNYKDDKEDGVWNQWYENGQLKLEAHYKDGKEHGLFTQWFENGIKRSEANFKDGKKEGYEILAKIVQARCRKMTPEELVEVSKDIQDEMLISVGVYRDLNNI